MNIPSEFGVYLKEKRINAKLKQDELASVIGKSGQYISNIENGKNNAPSKESDIELLINKLNLDENEAQLFRVKAAADRCRLPLDQMDYLFQHKCLLELITYGVQNNINDQCWKELLRSVSDGRRVQYREDGE